MGRDPNQNAADNQSEYGTGDDDEQLRLTREGNDTAQGTDAGMQLDPQTGLPLDPDRQRGYQCPRTLIPTPTRIGTVVG